MRPLLAAHEGVEAWERAPLRDRLGDKFALTSEERAQLLPSGRQRKFDNRVAWATTHLLKRASSAARRAGSPR